MFSRCVQIPIIDDNICEGDEEVLINLGSSDVNVIIAPNRSNGIIIINDNDGKIKQNYFLLFRQCMLQKCSISHSVALIGAAIIDPALSEGEVRECINERVTVRLSYSTRVRKGPNRSCHIVYQTADNTATGNKTTITVLYEYIVLYM